MEYCVGKTLWPSLYQLLMRKFQGLTIEGQAGSATCLSINSFKGLGFNDGIIDKAILNQSVVHEDASNQVNRQKLQDFPAIQVYKVKER